jgi:hypothetical protein
MRLLKLKTPLLALIFAVVALPLSFGLSALVDFVSRPQTSVGLLERCLWVFYYPAEVLAFLCLPGSSFEKGSEQPIQMLAVFIPFALLQWYLIFLIHIGVYRNYTRKSP